MKIKLILCTAIVGILVVGLVVVLVTRSNSSAIEQGPSAGRVAAALAEGNTPVAAASFADSFYGLTLTYPPNNWKVTSADLSKPHTIRLQSSGDRQRDAIATVAIQPYLPEPVSDALCEQPVEAKVAQRRALVCTYSYGNAYKHFEPMPHEWATISVTLITDNGPIYITAGVDRPLDPSLPPSLDGLQALADEAVQITSSIDLE